MYIRLFADTTGSAASETALEYMRSLVRAAPVRLVSVTGPLAGRWPAYGQLMATPMLGDFVSCVACDPARWTWMERVAMPERPINVGEIWHGKDLTIPGSGGVASGRVELYTHGKRNVLFAIMAPRSQAEIETAKRYEAVVIPSHFTPYDMKYGDLLATMLERQPIVLPVPVTDHKAMRDIVGL